MVGPPDVPATSHSLPHHFLRLPAVLQFHGELRALHPARGGHRGCGLYWFGQLCDRLSGPRLSARGGPYTCVHDLLHYSSIHYWPGARTIFPSAFPAEPTPEVAHVSALAAANRCFRDSVALAL